VIVAVTMLPQPELLPRVLPTDRLSAAGRPVPGLREHLRRIPNARTVVTIVSLYVQTAAVIVLAVWLRNPLVYAAAFVLMGRAHCQFNILGHEAAHRLLFSNRRVNDVVGRWLLAYPTFQALDLYRRAHMAHHREEFGPNEPDLDLYRGYPIPKDSFWRKMKRDAFFVSGWKNLKPLLRGILRPASRRLALSILGVQAVILAVCVATGHWWVYPVLWLAPWMTVWRVLNRLRAIAEHGGMTRSDDRRLTTHVVRQTAWAKFWMVPYNTGYHLAHHVDSGIPWPRLPRLHAELVGAGWVPADLQYRNYRALWRALRSG
jgi:fatty acid desaturase